MAAEGVKENVADRDRPNKCGIKPEKHPHVICRPKVGCDPPNKTAVQKRFVEEVNDV
jgi:hypothetical protein